MSHLKASNQECFTTIRSAIWLKFELLGGRRHAGQREYDAADVDRVKVIKAAQRLGFSLAAIQEMFDLSAHRRAAGELHARATAKVAEIDERIARL